MNNGANASVCTRPGAADSGSHGAWSGYRRVLRSNRAHVVVHTDHENGRPPLEWCFEIGPDGRVATVTAGPIVDGVDFTTTSPAGLSRLERNGLEAVFATAFADHDRTHLDRQVSTMSLVSTATT